MSSHLHRDLDALKREVLSMGGAVEAATNLALTALVDRDADALERALHADDAIDAHELQLEDACLKALALHQPVAGDLRYIIAIMKVTNDLERVGDLAQNVAEIAQALNQRQPFQPVMGLEVMGEKALTMLRDSLDALVNLNAGLARKVCKDDGAVDTLHREHFVTLQKMMKEDPSIIEEAVYVLSVSRHLERMADHATNIAEDIVFMAEGDVIRHQNRLTKKDRA